MWNWSESKWYIRIRYCPLLFPRKVSRNRWRHAEVTVSRVITWPPPNHRNSKRHRTSFVIQPQRKICCTCNAAYVRGPRLIFIADLASEIQMIRLFHYRAYGLSLTCKHHFTANVTKDICIIKHSYEASLALINAAGITMLYCLHRSIRESSPRRRRNDHSHCSSLALYTSV